MCVSEDGAARRVCTRQPDPGGPGGTGIQLWNTSTGELRATLTGPVSFANALAFSADGRWLALARNRLPVLLWDLSAGGERSPAALVFPKDLDSVQLLGLQRLRFSTDSCLLIASGNENAIVWDLGHLASPSFVEGTLSSDGRLIAHLERDDSLSVREYPSGAEHSRCYLGLGVDSARFPVFTPESRAIAVGVTYDAEDREFFQVLRGTLRRLLAGRPPQAPRGHELELKFIDADTGRDLGSLTDPPGKASPALTSLEVLFTAAGPAMALEGPDGIQLWDLPPRSPWLCILGWAAIPAGLILLTIVPRLRWLPLVVVLSAILGGLGYLGYQWLAQSEIAAAPPVSTPESPEKRVPPSPAPPQEWLDALAFSPDNKLLAAAGGIEDQTGVYRVLSKVVVWDVASGKVHARFVGGNGRCYHVSFSPDGKMLAAANVSGQVMLANIATGSDPVTFQAHPAYILSMAFSADGRTLATSSQGIITADGKTLATDSQGIIKLWDVPTGKQQAVLTVQPQYVGALCFSPDGTLLAAVADTVRIWDLRTLKEKRPLKHEGDFVRW